MQIRFQNPSDNLSASAGGEFGDLRMPGPFSERGFHTGFRAPYVLDSGKLVHVRNVFEKVCRNSGQKASEAAHRDCCEHPPYYVVSVIFIVCM